MQTNTRLIITLICVVSSFSLFTTVAFGQNFVNNTANTGDQSSTQILGSSPNYISPSTDTNDADQEMDTFINQIGTVAKKIAIGGANVLSNISGEIKKGLE
jgi:predicted PurR-regulated permease PerM